MNWVATVNERTGLSGVPSSSSVGDDRRVVFFEGTLYRRAALERELRGDSATSDVELVAAGYDKWGRDATARFDGAFGLLIWDLHTRSLLAVRDALGVEPLFYAERPCGLVLSNSLQAIIKHTGAGRSANAMALVGLLASRFSEHRETFLNGVFRVPQGHTLDWDGARVQLARYWDPAPPDQPIQWAEPDELVQFDQLFAQAVAARAIDRTAIYLSGGLDSVSVAAYAADALVEREDSLLALSLIFPEEVDESAVQRSVAASLRLPQVMLSLSDVVGRRGVLQNALDLVATWPAPLINIWLPAYMQLNREAAARGREVILTGGGGDEWLSASPFYAADLLRSHRVRELVAFTRAYNRSHPMPRRTLPLQLLWRFGIRPLMVDTASPLLERRARPLLRARLERILPHWLAPHRGIRDALLERSVAPPLTGDHGSFYGREIRGGLEHPVVDLEMEELFEAGARTGVRITQPFWDKPLLELLYRVHPDDLNRGGRSKGLVREALEQRFPQLGFGAQRKVSSLRYFADLMLDEGPGARAAIGTVTALADLGIVDSAGVERELDRILTRRDRWNAKWIWSILGLETWARAHS